MKRIVSALFVFIGLSAYGQNVISNQSEFDAFVKSANAGNALSVKFMPGTYVLKSQLVTQAPLSIVGNGATITSPSIDLKEESAVSETPTHYVFLHNGSITPFSLFVDENGDIVPVSESANSGNYVNFASKISGTAERKAGLDITIPISPDLAHLANKSFSNTFGYFDNGWSRIDFQVLRSDRKSFYCKTLDSNNVYNFNYERSGYSKDIRYVIYNAELKDDSVFFDSRFVYVPKRYHGVKCYACSVFETQEPSMKICSDFNVEGVNFLGINVIKLILDQKESFNISNCTFEKSLGETLVINKDCSKTSAISTITGCKFHNCALLSGSNISLMGNNTGMTRFVIRDCYFQRYDDGKILYKNCSGLVSLTGDVDFCNNTLVNSCRSHLYLYSGRIVVSDNTIFNTAGFNSYEARNLSSDWGLIYCGYLFDDSQKAIANKTNTILIENCFLHGAHAYSRDARGIMIDDGRGDVTCRHNLIFDTQSYSLDSRSVPNFVGTSSIRNVIEGNVLAGSYRVVGGKEMSDSDFPAVSGNLLLGDYKNVLGPHLRKGQDDKVYPVDGEIRVDGNYMFVPKSVYRQMKRHSSFSSIKRYLKISK